MQKNISAQWTKWLVLPLLLTACGGGNSEQNMATEPEITQPKGAIHSPSPADKSSLKDHSTTDSNAQSNSNSDSNSTSNANSTAKSEITVIVKTEKDVKVETSEKSELNPENEKEKTENPTKTVVKTKKTEQGEKIEKPETKEEVPVSEEIAKTPITVELVKKVIKAKESADNPGLPKYFEADYVITTPQGTTTAKLKAPEKSGNDTEDSTNYRFNAGLLFPAGESVGTMKSYLREDGIERKPHTEETFMSYQQFYSGISGSQKQIVYFDDERVERDEPFYFELPVGLLTTKEQLPTAGEATYHGKAIDGNRFGDFNYQVDFAAKEGKGGSIIWDKSSTGKLGDITLKGGKLSNQVLSVYSEPDLWPDEYSHHAPGITGVAEIAGNSAKNYQYTAVFFGPLAEELGGLVYEEKEHDGHSHAHGGLLGGEETEKTNITSFTGKR